MIDLLIIATNNYTHFLPALIASVDKHFYKIVTIHIFTDKVGEVVDMFVNKGNIRVHEVEHREWPYTTLYRFHFFQRYLSQLKGEYVFYVDADTKFIANVGDITSSRVAVQHCGYVGERGTYEDRPQSHAFVKQSEGTMYYGGGFWGFKFAEFTKFVNKAVWMVQEDRRNGITPVWHDESILNRYLIDNPPTLVLSPSYHYPENNEHIYGKWGGKDKYECILLLLDKKHEEIR